MDLIIEAVKKLENNLHHSGCGEGGVVLDVDPSIVNCQFERGACMTAVFGGKCGIFTTFDPLRVCTKVSFMFGAPLDTPIVRGAACAIINVFTGFFCMVRVLHPCKAASHASCLKSLNEELYGKRVCCIGPDPAIRQIPGIQVTETPSDADIILITGEGLICNGTGDLVAEFRHTKRILCLGPSTSGTARLHDLEIWCPDGCS